MKEGARAANRNLRRLLELTREMLALADEGDRDRQDDSCAILYGILRDSGYRLRRLAEQEEALTNLWHKLTHLRQAYRRERAALQEEIEAKTVELAQRRKEGRAFRRCQQGLQSRQRRLVDLTARFRRRRLLGHGSSAGQGTCIHGWGGSGSRPAPHATRP